MAKAKRVFQIARELGVESKAILEKCRAEGVELNNHMSSVSVGLEATVREWFSESGEQRGGTAVETAEKVDLRKAKARSKARRRAKPVESSAEEPAEAGSVAAGVEQKEPVSMPVEVEAAPEQAAVEAAEAPHAAPEPPAAEEPAVEAGAGIEIQPEAAEQGRPGDEPAAQETQEALPAEASDAEASDAESVHAAGPRLETPDAAKLRGPRLVRMEAPEPASGPRRSAGPVSSGAGPGSAPPRSPEVMRSRGPVRGKGAGGGETTEEEAGRSPRRRRRAAGRRGRSGESEVWSPNIRREQDLIEREQRLSRATGFLKRRRRDMRKRAEGGSIAPSPAEVGGKVEIPEPVTIKDLSAATGIKAAEIIKFLFNRGVMATINATIDAEAAMEVCLEHDIELVVKEAKTAEQRIVSELQDRERHDVKRRPPVVAVLGHVDHGKTSLLDRIRRSKVAAGEAGGITQHIGAFRAAIEGSDGAEKAVVFLDTPGHQAFTNMRSRGAGLADLVVLVVAADDGVMPQTIESISHAKAAGVPIVVALNKIDKPEATEGNIQRIFGQLAEHGLNPVEWGGQTEVVKVSAETGEGIHDLIEVLDFQAELLELKADHAGSAYGQVIEAELDPGRGPIARVLVQEGYLHVGDFVGSGRAFGKVRSMTDDDGRQVQTAGPATPVEISGIDEVPDAGDKFYVTTSLARAQEIAEQRRDQERKEELARKTKVTLDNVFEQIQASETKELRVVLKADVQGSVEVLRKALEEQGNEEVRVRVLHAAVGGITESDVLLAEASDAVVIGFQVVASPQARAEAERRRVDVRNYRVIYDIADDVRGALEGMLRPEKREQVLGHAEVRDVFRVSKVGVVAGCYVTDGVIRRNALIRVTRDGIVVEHDRTLQSLKRFKEDAREVRSGLECGMSIDGYDDVRSGDELECYVMTEVRPTLA